MPVPFNPLKLVVLNLFPTNEIGNYEGMAHPRPYHVHLVHYNIKKIILWEVQWSQDMIDELHRI